MNKKILVMNTKDELLSGLKKILIKKLKKNKNIVHVVTPKKIKEENCDKKIILDYLDKNNMKFCERKLKEILNLEKYDIIYCFDDIDSYLVRKISNKEKIVCFVSSSFFFKKAPLKEYLKNYIIEKSLAKKTNTYIMLNKEDSIYFKKHFDSNIKLINGIEFNNKNILNQKQILKLKKSLNINENDFIILYSSNLGENEKILIDIIKKLNKNIKLILTGTDYSQGSYKKEIERLKLSDRVIFTDYKNLNKIYQICDLGLSTNEKTELPYNITTPMFLKIPVIAFNSSNNQKLINNDVSGYLIDKNNYEEFLDKINFLYKNKKYSKNIGYNGFNYIANYLLDEVIDDIINI